MMNKPLDPFGNMNNMRNQMQRFMQNPQQFILQNKLNLPQNMQFNSPSEIMQHLVSSGQVTQDQINYVNGMSRQLQNNPQFQQILNSFNNGQRM